MSYVFNLGLITPWDTSFVYPMVFPHFEVFININEYANEITII